MSRASLRVAWAGIGGALALLHLLGGAPIAAEGGSETATTEPWIVYFPTEVSDVCYGIRVDTDPSDTSTVYPLRRKAPFLPDSLDSIAVARTTLYLMRRPNASGAPIRLPRWIGQGQHGPAQASIRLPMFAMECDSCREIGTCQPVIALFDTLGTCRATFRSARDPAWSPDGTRLAFRTVRQSMVLVEGREVPLPQAPESVIVFTPNTGDRWSSPVPTGVVSWADDEVLCLEFEGLRYSIDFKTGHVGRLHDQRRVVMAGVLSPDNRFVAHVGRDQVWNYQVRDDGVWDAAGEENFLPKIARLVNARTAMLSKRSFWLRGAAHPHHLCLGVGRMSQSGRGNMTTRYRDCETFVVDVEKLTIVKRIPGVFVGPASDGTHVVVWQDGQLKFIPL